MFAALLLSSAGNFFFVSKKFIQNKERKWNFTFPANNRFYNTGDGLNEL